MEQTPPLLGHNHPPLSIDEFLLAEDAPADIEILDALLKRWIDRHPEIAALAARAEKLAANRERSIDFREQPSRCARHCVLES